MVMGLQMGTSHRRRRCIRRASCRRRRQRQAAYRAVRHWSRRSRCRTTCTRNSIWYNTASRTNSTSCTRWTTCSTRRRCHRCTSSPCTRNSLLRSSRRLTLTPRCPVHYTPGWEVNLVSFNLLFYKIILAITNHKKWQGKVTNTKQKLHFKIIFNQEFSVDHPQKLKAFGTIEIESEFRNLYNTQTGSKMPNRLNNLQKHFPFALMKQWVSETIPFIPFPDYLLAEEAFKGISLFIKFTTSNTKGSPSV